MGIRRIMSADIVNVLTIDLEDYYMVSAFESVVKRENWQYYESRIECNTHRILDILSAASPHLPKLRDPISMPFTLEPEPGVKATFFCLGWVAERHPQLIKEIDRRGHEIACHSYDHKLVYNMTPKQFREDIRTSKRTLEDILGKKVIGYRAPSYSITEKSLWALKILAEEGYQYDSSIFPIHHDRYGIPTAPRFPFLINLEGGINIKFNMSTEFNSQMVNNLREADAIVEFPMSTGDYFGINTPISGGGYMRLLPYSVMKAGLRRINKTENRPFVFYIHPWEIDPDQPRFPNIPFSTRFRHYINLDKTIKKIKMLLLDFKFSSMKDSLGFC